MKTNNLRYLFLLLSVVFMTFSCTDDFNISTNLNTPIKMDLTQLEVGQKYHYSSFSGLRPLFDTLEVQYNDRILELEIREELEENVFIVSEKYFISYEKLMEGDGDNPSTSIPEEIRYTVWRVTDDKLKISLIDDPDHISNGSYFTWHTEFNLTPFQYESEQIQITQFVDRKFVNESNEEFYAINTAINGFTFDTLNLQIHGEPLSWDGGGTTALYSKEHGMVRIMNIWERGILGWDRIVL